MDPGGNIASMTSTDKEGVLDKYFYTYDNSGYISEINRNRRELDAVSGKYEYSYDAIGRLTKSTHDGAIKAEYQYDAFGNRTSLTEGDTSTTYSYDVLDRLLEVNELNNNQSVVKTYDYDKRGNQTNEYVDGVLNKTFTFDATGMMSKVTDSVKGQQENLYNGLGFRVETTRPEEHIEYLCDLSKDYFNLLERTVNGEKESFVYDKNVISMSKKGSNFYYLQDELGSPMYLTGTDGGAVSSYAFDDFGRNIDPRTGKQKHGYTKDGNIIQPFAFTGYQEDDFSGLKFAQARFYDDKNGRFVGEDQVRGFIIYPETINHYLYCINNPIIYVDNNGKWLNLAIGAVVGGIINGGLELYDEIKSGDGIDIGKVAISTLQGAVEGTAIASGNYFIAMGVQFVTDSICNNVKDGMDGELTVSEFVGNEAGALFNSLTVGGTMFGLDKLGNAIPKLTNRLFESGSHPVLEKFLSNFITQGELQGELEWLAKYMSSGAMDANEAAIILSEYIGQEAVVDTVVNRVTAEGDGTIDGIAEDVCAD